MSGECYKFTKILCSLCIEIDKPALKYLARCTGLNSIFDWLVLSFGCYLQTGRATCRLADPHAHLACYLAAYKLNETGK